MPDDRGFGKRRSRQRCSKVVHLDQKSVYVGEMTRLRGRLCGGRFAVVRGAGQVTPQPFLRTPKAEQQMSRGPDAPMRWTQSGEMLSSFRVAGDSTVP